MDDGAVIHFGRKKNERQGEIHEKRRKVSVIEKKKEV